MYSADLKTIFRRHLGKIAWPVALVVGVVAACVLCALFWVGHESDRVSVNRQVQMVLTSVDGTVNQTAQEQEVVAVWDDVLNKVHAAKLDESWLDENIGVWLHDLFHHDVVLILDSDGEPIYGTSQGKRTSLPALQLIMRQVRPLIRELRQPAPGYAPIHDRLPGKLVNPRSHLRTSPKSLHATSLMAINGRPAAVSVMQILPSGDKAVRDVAGREPLLISIRYLDGAYLQELGDRSLIAGPRFADKAEVRAGEHAAAIRGDKGERIGYLIWRPELPGRKMLALLAPVAAAALSLFAGAMAMMTFVLARSQTRLEATVTELTISEAEAIAQRRAAEVASLAKSDFLATMSHEIRTPLNAVVSAAHFLGQGALDATQREHVTMLQDGSSVLLSLVNDVLDLSRIEAGKLDLEATPFALLGEARGVVALWEPRAVDKAISLAITASDDLPHGVVLDLLRVKQILFNLLSNAIKFTEEGGVTLRVSRTTSELVFEVEDTGIGISAEGLERVFGAFEQAESGTARRFGGTGLGLAISRRLAELMGGSLTATSEPGRGSTFRLGLPLVEAEVGEADADDGEADEVSLEGLRVLVAEDHPVNRRVVELMLAPAGIDLIFAQDGVEAVEQAALQAFDVILMDMQMPRMGGLEATTAMRMGSGLNAATPVIALTANAMPQHREAWRAVGVETLVAKPIDPQQLAAALITAAAGYGPDIAEAA